MHATENNLSLEIRKRTIDLLQSRLSDSIDLFTQIKQAHWNVRGPNFIALHELFDKVAEIIEDQSDLLAERITALGGRADGTARTVANFSQLPEFPIDASSEDEFIAAVARHIAAFGQSVRHKFDEAASIGDAGTADIYTEISRALDQQLWLVESRPQNSPWQWAPV